MYLCYIHKKHKIVLTSPWRANFHPIGEDIVSFETACCRVKAPVVSFGFWISVEWKTRLCVKRQHSLGKKKKRLKTTNFFLEWGHCNPFSGTTFRTQHLAWPASPPLLLGQLELTFIHHVLGPWCVHGDQGHVMVDFTCWLDWARGCPDVWLHVILGVSVMVFLDEISIWIGRLSGLPSSVWVSLFQSLGNLNRTKRGSKGEFALSARMLDFSCAQARTALPALQASTYRWKTVGLLSRHNPVSWFLMINLFILDLIFWRIPTNPESLGEDKDAES